MYIMEDYDQLFSKRKSTPNRDQRKYWLLHKLIATYGDELQLHSIYTILNRFFVAFHRALSSPSTHNRALGIMTPEH